MSPPREPASQQGGAEKSPAILSLRQMRAVDALRASEVLSVAEIADPIGLSRAAATRVVEELVQLGAVDRRMDPDDRRRRQVRLTAAWLPDSAPSGGAS